MKSPIAAQPEGIIFNHRITFWLFVVVGLTGGVACCQGAEQGKAGKTGATSPEKTSEAKAQQRLEWNRKTLAGAYEQAGKKDAKWNEAALKALEETAQLRSLRNRDFSAQSKRIGELSHQATQAGCDDPLLGYLHTRYYSLTETTAAQSLERAWELDPTDSRICYNMITVELGMGEERKDMEVWFQRGMDLDTNNYELCRLRLPLRSMGRVSQTNRSPRRRCEPGVFRRSGAVR